MIGTPPPLLSRSLALLSAIQQRFDYLEFLSKVSLPGLIVGLLSPQGSAFLETSAF